MYKNDLRKLLAAAFGMLVLILDSKTALRGATQGVVICLKTIVPTLLPFFFFSILLTSSISGCGTRFLRPLGNLLKLPAGTEHIYLIGLLGGYPVGAQCVSQAVENGSLASSDAERMIVFFNNCGPAFLFGIVGVFFPQSWMIWLLWMVQIISSVIVGVLIPAAPSKPVKFHSSPVSAVAALKRSLWIMAQVCGWVILFRMGITFLDHWFGFFLHPNVRTALWGFLELANGCLSLDSIADMGQRFVLCSAMLATGGLCVTMQTFGVLSPNISKRYYLPGKVLQMSISIILAYFINLFVIQGAVSTMTNVVAFVVATICFIFFRNVEKKGRNFAYCSV